jgi:hypothetical protein
MAQMSSFRIVTALLVSMTGKLLASEVKTPLMVLNIGSPAYSTDGANDQPAFQKAIDDCPASGCAIHIPNGEYNFASGLTITHGKNISFVGESRGNTWLKKAFADGTLMNFAGTEPSRIAGIEIRNLTIEGDGTGVGISLSWVLKSRIENVDLQSLWDGVTCQSSFTNTFANNNTYLLSDDAYQLGNECNNNLFLNTAFGSARFGIHVLGSVNGLAIVASNCESIPANGYCVYLEPPVGKRVDGVTIQATHFEQVAGGALYAWGQSPNSILNLKFDNNVVLGQFHDADNNATSDSAYAVILRNVSGFDVSNNFISNWKDAAVFVDGTESYGAIERNTLLQRNGSASLPLSSAPFTPTVRVSNNVGWSEGVHPTPANSPTTPVGIGRQEIFRSPSPTGACQAGDIAWNNAPVAGGNVGWVCVASGSWRAFGPIQ